MCIRDSNGAVLSSVFLAVAIGLSMNTLGESRTATLRRLLGEVNDVVAVSYTHLDVYKRQGVIPSMMYLRYYSFTFPRLRGGDPSFILRRNSERGFSPPTRG